MHPCSFCLDEYYFIKPNDPARIIKPFLILLSHLQEGARRGERRRGILIDIGCMVDSRRRIFTQKFDKTSLCAWYEQKLTTNSYELTLPEFVSVRISSLFFSICLFFSCSFMNHISGLTMWRVMGANKWNKKIEKSMRIRVIRVLHLPADSCARKQAQARPFRIPPAYSRLSDQPVAPPGRQN
ncbi:MAG: hypothetical protein OIN88_05195 [Candidatus Methanoperedens sp.]|nr:hypothetical protein [Candidatus Methanoperedens sp.]